ncbi:protein dachsous [Trichonephila clavipes]|nr:protein dachsous [Trichonephila clavipes]
MGSLSLTSLIVTTIVALEDREVKPNYTMVVTATDQGNPPLNTSVTDTNDNAPEFDHTMYYTNVLEVADPSNCLPWIGTKGTTRLCLIPLKTRLKLIHNGFRLIAAQV